MNKLLSGAAFAVALSATAGLADTTCVRDEQKGCLTFQIVGIEYNAGLMAKVEKMSAATQAKTLGMKVFEGMIAGKYEPAGNQDYHLILWMDESWGDQPIPADRIVQVCYTGLKSGQYETYKPRGLSLSELGGVPAIKGADGDLKHAHTALDANCDGGVGAGWVIPKDVAEHIDFAMVCADGVTNYPFNVGGNQQGVLHSGREINWYLSQGWEFVLSAAIR